MINAIQINDETNNYVDEDGNTLFALYDLNRVNIFIGENNSGKSRLMRTMLTNKNCKVITDEPCSDNINQRISVLIRNLEPTISAIRSLSDVPSLGFDCQSLYALLQNHQYAEMYKLLSQKINQWERSVYKNGEPNSPRVKGLAQRLSTDLFTYVTYTAKSTVNNNFYTGEIYGGRIFYIPVLRGIENFDSYFDKSVLEKVDSAQLNREQWRAVDNYAKNSGHIYEEKISKAYGIDKKCIFTAENLYEDIRDKLLGRETQRTQIGDFEDFISRNFYNGDKFTLIPRQVKNADGTYREFLAVKIGTSEERPLHHLGDGIKQMITLLYKAYEKKGQEAIFLIEEPEINLHPGYQKMLMRLLLQSEEFKKQQFFIVTHSNHILESFTNSDDVSVYKVINTSKKNNSFKVIPSTSKDTAILDLLGVSNMSVMLANSLIFVEGLSDKILVQKYLETYFMKHNLNFQEGTHYAFVETGGGNIAHWNFLDDVTDNGMAEIQASHFSHQSFIICDNDNGKKAKRKERLKEMVGEENFVELPVREIENTIKRSVLEKTLFGDVKIVKKKEYDENNTNINSRCCGYYCQKKMGNFIDSHYKLQKKYAAKSGTINEKVKFAKEVAKNISSYEDLSSIAIDICKKIASFIEKANTVK